MGRSTPSQVMNIRFSLVALAALCTASVAHAQISPYVVMAGDQRNFHVLQGGQVVRSWSTPAGTAQYQYPVTVTGTIRTMGANPGDIGAEYDFSGNELGTRYTHPGVASRCWDGTTDGTHNYAIDTGGLVTRFDRDWTNPVVLFDAGGIGALTYDPTSDSLWVSQFSGSMDVVNYSFTGTMLGSFSTGHTQNMALAMDHADGTLWLHDRNARGTFEQWTTAGVLIQRIAIPGMNTENALGGEMPLPGSATCTLRNGTGINPTDYRCRSLPVVGGTWTSTFNTGANTTNTILWASTSPGTLNGIPGITQGEVLISFPNLLFSLVGTGDLSLPVPQLPALFGFTLSTQGARVESVGTPIVLLNALDVSFGF